MSQEPKQNCFKGGVIKGSGVCPGPKGGEAAILAISPHRGKGRREARPRGLEERAIKYPVRK